MKKFLLSLIAVFAVLPTFAQSWEKATEIAVGDVVVLAVDNGTVTKELSTVTTTGTTIGQVVDYTTTPEGVYPLTVVAGADEGTVAFQNAEGAYLAWETGNSLKTSETLDAAASWTISYANEKWDIYNVGTPARKLQYNAASPRFACYGNSNQTAVDLWKQVADGSLAKPSLTGSATFYGSKTVEITAAEGATIYYTVNGEDPTVESTVYTEALTITETTTVKAIAVKGEQISDVAEATYTLGITYTLAEANAAATSDKAVVRVAFTEALVTFVSGQNSYIQDATGGMLVYGNSGLNAGDKISGYIQGQLYLYNGLPEVASPTVEVEVVSSDNEVTPKAVSAADLAANPLKYVSQYVVVEDAVFDNDIAEAKKSNYNFTAAGENLVLRNNFTVELAVTAGALYKVAGLMTIYNTTLQLYPIAATDVTEIVIAEPTNLDFSLTTPVSAGIRTYAKDLTGEGETSGAQPVEGWTIAENGDARAAGVYAYGSGLFLGGDGYNVPAANPAGEAVGNALGIIAVWSARTQYTQEVVLEPGIYELTIPVFNVKGGTSNVAKNLIGFIAADGTEYLATAKTYAVDQWTNEVVSFTLEHKTRGVLSLGYSMTNAGSGSAPHLFIDGVTISTITQEDLLHNELANALVAPTATVEAKANVGDQLFQKPEAAYETFAAAVADQQAVADNAEATAEELQAAIDALKDAVAAYDAAVIAPEEGAAYSLQLKEGGMYLSLNEGTKLSARIAALSFVPVEGGWAITNGEEYVANNGNAWTMGFATEPYAWVITLQDGYYHIAKASNTNQHIGADTTTDGSACYADKGISDKSLWTIKKVAAIDRLSSDLAYNITTARGAWMYDEAGNRMHYTALPAVDADEETVAAFNDALATDAYKFAIVKKDGASYLYSLGAKKFVQPQKYFVEGVPTPITLVEDGAKLKMKAANSTLTMNIGGNQWTWDTWTATDDGNAITIEAVGEFDPAEALAMLENTALDQHKVFTVTTKRGQWAASADGTSLASVATNPEATDADKQFSFYYADGQIYIYSVGAKKFLKKDGSLFAGKGDPVDFRIVSTEDYAMCFFFTEDAIYFNMQGAGGFALNTWSTPDDGNRQELAVVEDVDVYDEAARVFGNALLNITYDVVWNDKVLASETVEHVQGDAVKIPASLDRGLCTLTPDAETITGDTEKITVNAEWNGLFDFSEDIENAKWYTMTIRGNWQVSKCENEPYTMKQNATEEELASPEFQWAFGGDPYNLVIYNKATGAAQSLQPADGNAVLRDGDYKWELFGNSDGFVIREAGTDNSWVNQSGGGKVEAPLAFWNSANGKTDNGSTFRITEAPEPQPAEVDVTELIQNPAYLENGYEGWSYTENGFKARSYEAPMNLITYSGNAAFEVSQTIENVPAGLYKLTVNAFYRAGSLDDEKAKIEAGTELEKELTMYAMTAADDQYSKKVMNLSEGATDVAYGEGTTQLANGKFVPNSAAESRAWYIAGEYTNEVLFNVFEDGSVTIGLSKTEGIAGDYCPIGAWKLYRLGDADADKATPDEKPVVPVELQPGDDATAFITNPSFETGDATGWNVISSADTGVKPNSNGTYTTEGVDGEYLFNTWWQGTPITQTVKGLPNGVYELKALMTNDAITAGDQPCLYLIANGLHSEAFSSPAANVFAEGSVQFYVTDGTATIGAVGGNADGSFRADGYYWYKADNFRLTYISALPDIAEIEIPEGKMSNDAAAAITAAQQAQDVVALLEAVKVAEVSIKAYADAAAAIENANALMATTNVFTAEAFDAYKAIYDNAKAKYEAGTLADAEAAALENPFLVTGWQHDAGKLADDLLLSAWTINDVKAKDFETSLYINTWSVEGENDGTEFKVPFFEYWTGDDNSLGAATIKAELTGLEEGNYEVAIWARVRAKNGVAATDATGVTLQVNEGNVADLTEGEAVGQFNVAKYKAVGDVLDGKLVITLNIAEDNNVSWLSFRDVTYTRLSSVGIRDLDRELENAAIFDLSGRKISKTQKGIYIINGRKVVVK